MQARTSTLTSVFFCELKIKVGWKPFYLFFISFRSKFWFHTKFSGFLYFFHAHIFFPGDFIFFARGENPFQGQRLEDFADFLPFFHWNISGYVSGAPNDLTCVIYCNFQAQKLMFTRTFGEVFRISFGRNFFSRA